MEVRKDRPLFAMETMEQVISDSLSTRRFQTLLLGIFAAVALALAAVGIYAVVSYSVSQRTHEIGIRMALGSRQGDVLRRTLSEGLSMALRGVAIGLAASLALRHALSGLLYGVSSSDPLTFVAVPSVLLAVALLACYLPARRATKVDPIIALRHR